MVKPSEVTQAEWDNDDLMLTLTAKSSQTPMLWDAAVTIKGDNLEIQGYLEAGGPTNADATLIMKKSVADEWYDVYALGDKVEDYEDGKFLDNLS